MTTTIAPAPGPVQAGLVDVPDPQVPETATHLARLLHSFGVRTLGGLVAAGVVAGLLIAGQGSLDAISLIDPDTLGSAGSDQLRE